MNSPLYKVQPMKHQHTALAFIKSKNYYALLMEQGTGKTPVEINDSAQRWGRGEMDGMLVMAPSGVHTNWTLREIPMHMPDWAQHFAATWHASPTKAEARVLDDLYRPEFSRHLRILAMNWESLITKDGFAMATRFAKSCRQLKIVGDESQRVKNPDAKRTRQLEKLRQFSTYRSILSGTAIVQSPWDAFSQFGFLHRSILQFESYAAFKCEYAEMLPGGHGLLRHIVQRHEPGVRAMFRREMDAARSEPDEMTRRLEMNRVETLIIEELNKRAPKMVAKDEITGLPKWRNLEQLSKLIEPYTFRVLKSECLDLPPKVYTQRFFRMSTGQRKQYNLLKEELRLQLENGTIQPVERIASVTKLSQIVSGYFIVPGTQMVNRIMPIEDNPKLKSLMDELDDCLESGAQVIVWARFHAEIEDISKLLSAASIKHVQYHGNVSHSSRQLAIDAFQAGRAKVFVGQQAAGGTGITLTAASNVIYYSNSWSLEDRLQSEDRAHRIGQVKSVRYVDIIAQDTIDENVVKALRGKTDVARTIMGDARRLAAML